MRKALLSLLLAALPSCGAQEAPTRAQLEARREELRSAAALSPKDHELWRRLGFTCQALGEAKAALAAFRRVVELKPEDAGGWYMLALAHEKLEEKAAALEAWRACLRLARDPKMLQTAERHIEHLSR